MLRWPEPDQVLQQVQAWANEQRGRRPSLQAVGLFGSYGRGTAGVGSDLDQLMASGSRMALELQRDLRWLQEHGTLRSWAPGTFGVCGLVD